MEAEVNNGGFFQYFINSSGNHVNQVSACFRAIGAEKTASICQSALSAFSQALPENQKERLAYLKKALTQKAEDILDTCDDRFNEYEDDLTELQYRYLLAHQDAF